MLSGVSDAGHLAIAGLLGGVCLGLAARLGRFCTLGAIEDYLYQSSDIRLRMWALAIGVSGMATFALIGLGLLNPAATVYHATAFSPVLAILGGLMFGYGMSLAGNCGFGALARLGGGDLRSFVIVLVMGISAYIAISGPLATLRMSAISATELTTDLRTIPELVRSLTGTALTPTGLALSFLITLAAVWSGDFLKDRKAVFWGALVGLTIASGWAASNWVSVNGFMTVPLVSHSYTRPLGETLLFVMTSSGGGLSFGVGSVFGVLAGAFCGSLYKGHFRWEACEDPRELKRQVLGAVLMGFGAVLAIGCTIGQGISAFSLLTFSAPLVFASIFAGAAIGLRQLITGYSLGGLQE